MRNTSIYKLYSTSCNSFGLFDDVNKLELSGTTLREFSISIDFVALVTPSPMEKPK